LLPVAAKPTYKLRFPSNGAGLSKYLMFTENGSLLLETTDYKRPFHQRYAWIEPEDTIKFLEAVGEGGRQPEFVGGDPTNATKALLRRLLKQFSCTTDLHRCWKRIGIHSKAFNLQGSSD
jgi:hypothetical protein